jgi:hypothetical protein
VHRLGDSNQGLWFKIHFSFIELVLICSVVGTAIAVAAKREQQVNGVESTMPTLCKIGSGL